MRVRRLRRFTINVFFLRLKEENDARESVESLKQRRLLNDQSVRPIKISHGEENLTSVKSVVKTRHEVTLTARQGRRPFVSLTVIIFHLFLPVTRPSISKMDCARDTSGRCIRGWIVRSRAIIQRIARKKKKEKNGAYLKKLIADPARRLSEKNWSLKRSSCSTRGKIVADGGKKRKVSCPLVFSERERQRFSSLISTTAI